MSEASPYRVLRGEGLPELDRRLSDELDELNMAAASRRPTLVPAHGSVLDDSDALIAASAAGRGVTAVLGITSVREDACVAGVGAGLLAEFADEARARGCTHVFVTSFTFQAPRLYEPTGTARSSVGKACPHRRLPMCAP